MNEETIQQAYRYCPGCATVNPKPGSVPFRCQQCNFSQFFGPVAAVGGLVINEKNQLLMVRRAKDPGKGLLGLPGGFVDADETVEGALAREIQEETALQVTSFQYMMSAPNRYVHDGIEAAVIDFFYLCEVHQTDEIKLDHHELSDFLWVVPTQDHLKSMAFDSNRQAVQQWMRNR